MTRERPIIMSAPMVSAILDRRKSQTWRLLKPQPPADWRPAHWCELHRAVDGEPVEPRTKRDVLGWGWCEDDGLRGFTSPYAPGDLLWVRERCRAEELGDGLDGVRYLADDHFAPIENTREAADRWMDLYHYRYERHGRGATVPPIHMPRWASRITLRVTEVRVQRLQEISYDDCRDEATECPIHGAIRHTACSALRVGFAATWDDLNDKPGARWDDNPWVAAIRFERV